MLSISKEFIHGVRLRKQAIITIIAALFITPLYAGDNTFLDYQNYNHGYCPDCNHCPCDCPARPYKSCPQQSDDCPEAPVVDEDIQACYPSCPEEPCDACGPVEEPNAEMCTPECDPCAPVCGVESGFSICAVGLALFAIGAAAAVIVTSNNGSSSFHS